MTITITITKTITIRIAKTTAVNGLWSLANCNSVAMLGICEFE